MGAILTVDDSLSARQVLSVTLRGGGYEVIPAADGLAALEIARETRVDLVITDLYMPRMNGIQLLGELRRLPNYRTIPVLLVSIDTRAERKLAARRAGASGWIGKPFNPDRLLDTVRRVLD